MAKNRKPNSTTYYILTYPDGSIAPIKLDAGQELTAPDVVEIEEFNNEVQWENAAVDAADQEYFDSYIGRSPGRSAENKHRGRDNKIKE